MDIRYSQRSQFLEACEAAIREHRAELNRGGVVRVDLGPGGYQETVTVFISQGDRQAFHTNWSSPDPSRFPVRIKAAATALRNCGCSGTYEITHRQGVITLSSMTATARQLPSKPSAVALARPIGGLPTEMPASPKPAPSPLFPAVESSTTRIFLVSCVEQKLPYAAAARDLYTSEWFLKARRYVEAQQAPWFILSAAHGLLHPHQMVAPYERTLNNMGVAERRTWADQVMAQLEVLLPGVDSVEFIAGERYRENLVPELERRAIHVSVPMAGLRIGEQLSWLTHNNDAPLK